MQLGMIGLGRMGGGMVRRLLRGGHACVVFDAQAAGSNPASPSWRIHGGEEFTATEIPATATTSTNHPGASDDHKPSTGAPA